MLQHLPYIMVGAALVLSKTPISFAVCLALNVVLNQALKRCIKQRRPQGCASYLKNSYGMPSGHSQVASFVTAFTWADVQPNQQLLLAVLTAATMVQRVVSKCHTVAQVFAGLLIGAVFGFASYRAAKTVREKTKRSSF